MRVTAKVGALKVLLDHSQEGLELVTVYYLMHRWARFLPGILGVVLDPTVPTEAFLFVDECQISVFQVGEKKQVMSYTAIMLKSYPLTLF